MLKDMKIRICTANVFLIANLVINPNREKAINFASISDCRDRIE